MTLHRLARLTPLTILVLTLLTSGLAQAADLPTEATSPEGLPWWGWAVALFVVSFGLGIVAVLGGVGGGVLFVPIVGGFFPFHLDFVRGAGLLVALAGALAAGPGLLSSGMASLRLAAPLALLASISAIAGAMIGLALPTNVVQLALGTTILGIVVLMFFAKKSEYPEVGKADNLSAALKMNGVFNDAYSGKSVDWKVHRTPQGLAMFVVIGMMAGMFGLGAGWANVPVLNLLMGAPLKVSVATSKFMLSIVDTAAAWVYLNQGAVLAIIAVPSIIGIMLGSLIGVRLLKRANASLVRKVVIVMLLLAGSRALLKGLGI
ncbi:MAG: sulfite exporter TauE/SafE family protein [Rhodospirillales bacterium]|nr:sulfite exporter TauE/SafE family protein [Rhodospirillales bacterium]